MAYEVDRASAAPRGRTAAMPFWERGAGELFAGSVAACVTLAGWLTVSLLAYAPLGGRAAQEGIAAGCITVVVGSLLVVLLGRSAMPGAGPSLASVLIFASGVARLGADPALAEQGVAVVAAFAALSVVLMGAMQWMFAVLRLGSVAGYVPHPVLAGFMNGVAVLVAVAQLPFLLGHAGGDAAAAAPAGSWVGPLLLGGLTAVVAIVVARRFPKAPGALIGLCVGCLSFVALHAAWPSLWLGSVTGALPSAMPVPAGWRLIGGDARMAALLLQHLPALALTALLLALVGSLETVLNAVSVDRALLERHDPNRALFAFGCANVASGLLGGLPVAFWRSQATALRAAGGQGRAALAACAGATLLLYLFGNALIERLPLAVLGGLMLVVAWNSIDGWTRQSLGRVVRGDRSPALWQSLALVATVCGVTVWRGFVAGVAVGLALSIVLFIRAMNRSLVRLRYGAADRPSRRQYPAAREAVLGPLRPGIAVLELEGALFFGNAERLADTVERLDPGVRFIVLDVRRIGTIDGSGVFSLAQTAARLARTGRRLSIAGAPAVPRPGGGPAQAAGLPFDIDGVPAFDDADQAIESCEQVLLQEAGSGLAEGAIDLMDCALFQGLASGQLERLRAALQSRTLAAGELLFREGDAADCLYVLAQGSMTVSSLRDAGRGLRQRYLSFSAGMTFGETALLDGRGRSADASADTPCVVYALSRDALARLAEEDPPLAQRVMTNIALHLSERLRQASTAWRHAAG